MALVTGTIRKAQNLLKQYSQHGLDGKKGGSNLIPLEGNHPVFLSCSLLLQPCVHSRGRAEPPTPQEGLGRDPEKGAGWELQGPGPPAPAGADRPRGPRPGPVWLTAALPSRRLPTPSPPCLCPCLLFELRASSLSWAALSRLDQQSRTKLASASWPPPPPRTLERGACAARGRAVRGRTAPPPGGPDPPLKV